jgi:hypothetical protein
MSPRDQGQQEQGWFQPPYLRCHTVREVETNTVALCLSLHPGIAAKPVELPRSRRAGEGDWVATYWVAHREVTRAAIRQCGLSRLWAIETAR